PACGGFGELYVYGGAVASSPPPSSGAGARSASDAQAIVKALLEKNKGGCNMTYSTITVTTVSGGWNVAADVVTSGNANTAHFGVATGGTSATPADQLAAEIEA